MTMGWLWFLIIGVIAGWLAGKITRGSGFGLVGDMIVGVIGALLGGFIIGLVEAFSGFYVPELKEAVYFVVFIIVLLIRPTGLFGVVGAEEVGLK